MKTQITQWVRIEILGPYMCVFTYTTLPLPYEKACLLQRFPNVLLAICKVCLQNQSACWVKRLSLRGVPRTSTTRPLTGIWYADLKHLTK